MDYRYKYTKYKIKYLQLLKKNYIGGSIDQDYENIYNKINHLQKHWSLDFSESYYKNDSIPELKEINNKINHLQKHWYLVFLESYFKDDSISELEELNNKYEAINIYFDKNDKLNNKYKILFYLNEFLVEYIRYYENLDYVINNFHNYLYKIYAIRKNSDDIISSSIAGFSIDLAISFEYYKKRNRLLDKILKDNNLLDYSKELEKYDYEIIKKEIKEINRLKMSFFKKHHRFNEEKDTKYINEIILIKINKTMKLKKLIVEINEKINTFENMNINIFKTRINELLYQSESLTKDKFKEELSKFFSELDKHYEILKKKELSNKVKKEIENLIQELINEIKTSNLEKLSTINYNYKLMSILENKINDVNRELDLDLNLNNLYNEYSIKIEDEIETTIFDKNESEDKQNYYFFYLKNPKKISELEDFDKFHYFKHNLQKKFSDKNKIQIVGYMDEKKQIKKKEHLNEANIYVGNRVK